MNRDQLDQAIDQVAARLTKVDGNDAFASQIINALPDRVSWFGWWFHSWAPRLAMIAVVVVVSGIIWGNRREASAPGVSPLASSQPITAPTVLAASAREAAPNRTIPLERLEPLEALEPERSDFERSLEAIDSLPALTLTAVAPKDLPAESTLAVEPLAIADLPLAPDTISPR